MNLHHLVDQTAFIARQAGAMLRDGFGTDMSIAGKSGRHNLVTEYDLKVERFLHEQLSALVPSSRFLGEEGGLQSAWADSETDSVLADHSGSGEQLLWVVDPLDGTVNFAHGIPIFCLSIGAAVNGLLVLAVIYNPMMDELFTASLGNGAFLNGKQLSVSSTPDVAGSIMVTGFPYDVQNNPLNCLEQFTEIVGRGIPVRRLGSAALDLAYVAAGRFDAFWEVHLQPWDMAAGALLVTEAGGRVTKYDNEPFELEASSIVATNGHVHDELVDVLQSVTTS